MSPANMLELQKLVLENVYENRHLFAKELKKSFKWLGQDDLMLLYHWAIGKFSDRYQNVINSTYLELYFQKSEAESVYAMG